MARLEIILFLLSGIIVRSRYSIERDHRMLLLPSAVQNTALILELSDDKCLIKYTWDANDNNKVPRDKKGNDFVDGIIHGVTPMEGLELIKLRYASNFERVYMEDESGEYFYQLPMEPSIGQPEGEYYYYLTFEGLEDDGIHYIYHLYEFVLDDPETGMGHTVTYGWYAVNKDTAEIIDRMLP